MDDSFAEAAIAGIKALTSITLWRVGEHAAGPGHDRRDPPITAWAVHHGTGWAYALDGDASFESSSPPIASGASVSEAQSTIVALVARATRHEVVAVWSEVDADTWSADASFVS